MEKRSNQPNGSSGINPASLTTLGLLLAQLSLPTIAQAHEIRSSKDTPPHFSTSPDSLGAITVWWREDGLIYLAPLADGNSIEFSPTAANVVVALMTEDPRRISEDEVANIIIRNQHRSHGSVALPGLPLNSLQKISLDKAKEERLYCVIIAIDDLTANSGSQKQTQAQALNAIRKGEFYIISTLAVDPRTKRVE